MGNIFGGQSFTNSKIVSRKILSDDIGNLNIDKPGNFTKSVSLKSGTKAAINPTSDSDDGNPRASGLKDGYGISGGGASGDKSTGYPWKGEGISQLDNAHGNNAKRSLNYGN